MSVVSALVTVLIFACLANTHGNLVPQSSGEQLLAGRKQVRYPVNLADLHSGSICGADEFEHEVQSGSRQIRTCEKCSPVCNKTANTHNVRFCINNCRMYLTGLLNGDDSRFDLCSLKTQFYFGPLNSCLDCGKVCDPTVTKSFPEIYIYCQLVCFNKTGQSGEAVSINPPEPRVNGIGDVNHTVTTKDISHGNWTGGQTDKQANEQIPTGLPTVIDVITAEPGPETVKAQGNYRTIWIACGVIGGLSVVIPVVVCVIKRKRYGQINRVEEEMPENNSETSGQRDSNPSHSSQGQLSPSKPRTPPQCHLLSDDEQNSLILHLLKGADYTSKR